MIGVVRPLYPQLNGIPSTLLVLVALPLLQFILQCILSFSFTRIRRFFLHFPVLLNSSYDSTFFSSLTMVQSHSLPSYLHYVPIYISHRVFFLRISLLFLPNPSRFIRFSFPLRSILFFAFLFSPSRHSSSRFPPFLSVIFCVPYTHPLFLPSSPLFLVVFVL